LTRIVPAAALAIALLLPSSCGKKQEADTPVLRSIVGARNPASEEQEGPSGVPDSVLAVRILPAISGTGKRLSLSATGFSLGDGEIEWKVDGEPVPGAHEDSFSTEGVGKGASVQARVTVGGREVASNTVTLVNTPPGIRSVRIVPDVIRPGDSIGVEAAGIDPDGDEVTFEYRWEKNGQPAGTGDRLEGALHRGDVVSVRITPYDGEARGDYLVVRREVKNYPPSFTGVSDARLEGGVYTCTVGATDGDNDPLTYALTGAPSGMSIDPGTGTIRWTVPAGFTGKAPVTVTVKDGQGGEASYPMSVTIREESPKK
jgi:Putative Ig domain